MTDKLETTGPLYPEKRMPLMMEQDRHIVGVVDAPPVRNWSLIVALLRALASKIEETLCQMNRKRPTQ